MIIKFIQSVNLKRALLLAITFGVVIVWLILTPSGLLGKADAIGYAVCHQIADRSFLFADRPMPLCARCTGMYLGAFFSLVMLMRGRKAGLPSLPILISLGLFVLFFAVDGLNSYLHFFPGAPWLYEPANWLRLASGTALGLGIPVFLVPIFNQTVWKEPDPSMVLSGWKGFFSLIGFVVFADLAALSDNYLLMFVVAIISTATVIAVLGITYSVIILLIRKKENHYNSWMELWPSLLAGFLAAFIQIAVLDAARYALTGTWAGFTF